MWHGQSGSRGRGRSPVAGHHGHPLWYPCVIAVCPLGLTPTCSPPNRPGPRGSFTRTGIFSVVDSRFPLYRFLPQRGSLHYEILMELCLRFPIETVG